MDTGTLNSADVTMTNPYLDEFTALNISGYDDRSGFEATMVMLDARDRMVREYAWAVPDDAAIATLVALGPIIEIGAGAGYWASLVHSSGGDIIAFDASPVGTAQNDYIGATSWIDVTEGDTDVAAHHPDRALMLCWPPYNQPMALNALRAYEGSTVAYVGEGFQGCTADDAFHEMLRAEFDTRSYHRIPTWPSRSDALAIYQRR